MSFFKIFLPTLAFLLSIISLGVLYFSIKGSKKSEFITVFYFLGLSFSGTLFLSLSRIVKTLYSEELFNFVLIQDLMVSYIALFLFGALWQSYEASIVEPPSWIDEE